jgi:hypothetical protein
VKLDPEERIIAAALDQAELDDANERGAGARIEFKREGHAKVTITISRELVEQARALDLTTGELFAEAIRLAVPGAFDLAPPTSPAMALTDLSPLGPGQNYVDFARAALQANQPILPSEHRRFSAVSPGHLRGVGFDLMLAGFAPHDQPHTSRSGSPGGPR